MTTKPDGGPAFPHPTRHTIKGEGLIVDATIPGMSVRDYASIKFAAAMIASPSLLEAVTAGHVRDGTAAEAVVRSAFNWADAWIAERGKL